ncbi:exoribonuclease 2, partial [Paraphysoderma sedebokerense]
MGVPALFRWLTQKYPKITTSVVEEQPLVINGHKIPVDISKTNPNGMEFDNLYLDMNGIIHPCCHPEDKPAPATEDEMMIAIFEYIDRIMGMIRPRKLLYMAIDGVAPRAKMNQQRSRRFRAALEVIEKQEKEEEIQADLEDRGQPADGTDGNDKPEPFDSNCITPGTPFMSNLAVALRYYISERLNSDPGWKHLKVLMSDASVPGEGEHKIMDYIRRQRVSPDYDANTRHVLYGLDADLIMLALATHEPHFKILREDVFFQERNKRNNNNNNSNPRHQGRHDDKVQQMLDQYQDPHQTKPFIFLHVNILREYLEHELRYDNMPFPFDLERAIDDWVFLCFFVGNDFLPHLPSLEIREGAIDLLIELYKKNLDKVGGYLTEKGNVYLDRVQLLLTELGQVEDVIFQRRRMQEEKRQKD